MNPVLNIGMAIGTTGETMTVVQVIQAIQYAGLKLAAMRVVESDTEPTVVAEIAHARRDGAVRILADMLGQDAVAIYYGDGHGALIGARAAEWGEFNPEFFFTLDGRRLREPATAEA